MQNTFHLFCLAAPVLGLLQLLIRFGLQPGPTAMRLRAVWNEEHWLLTDALGEARGALATPVFCCIAVLWWGTAALTFLVELWAPPGMPTALATLRSLALAGLLLGKIFLLTRWSGRQILLGGLAAGLWCYVASVSGYSPLSDALLLLFAVKDTHLFADLCSVLAAQTLDFALTVGQALAGLRGNMTTAFDTGRARLRMALGYGSYNACGIAAASIVLLYLCVRWRRLRWWDLLLVLGAVVFIDLVPNSRSAELLCLIILAAALLFRALPRLPESRWAAALAAAAAPLLCALSYLLACLYREDSALFTRLDSLLSGRIRLAWNTLFNNPFTHWEWFGQPFITWNFYSVDNSYVYYLFLCGPFFVALLVLGGALLCWRLARSGGWDGILLACALGWLAYAFMERAVYPNLLVLLAANAMFGGGERPLTLNRPHRLGVRGPGGLGSGWGKGRRYGGRGRKRFGR